MICLWLIFIHIISTLQYLFIRKLIKMRLIRNTLILFIQTINTN